MAIGKKELVDLVKEKTGSSKEQAQKAIEAVLESISDSLQKGEEVRLIGFGTFASQRSEARNGINPKTKEPIKIAASNRASFKAGKELKEKLNLAQG